MFAQVAIFILSLFDQVELIEEFEPGRDSYVDTLLQIKACQARVYFLYAR